VVSGKGTIADGGAPAVDRHAAGADQVFGGTATGDPGPREQALEPLTARFRGLAERVGTRLLGCRSPLRAGAALLLARGGGRSLARLACVVPAAPRWLLVVSGSGHGPSS